MPTVAGGDRPLPGAAAIWPAIKRHRMMKLIQNSRHFARLNFCGVAKGRPGGPDRLASGSRYRIGWNGGGNIEGSMAKLAILDPSGLFRAALLSLLRNLGFDDLTEAADLEELERRVSGDPKPDVLLINLTRGDDAVDRVMDRVRTMLPDAKVVFLARSLDLDLLAAVFAAGASGYLLENTSGDALGKSLTLVNAGGAVFPRELASFIPHLAARRMAPPSLAAMPRDTRLSGREIEILECLTRGQSNKAIAHALDIAEATVKVHVKRILRKIDVTNRTQAALWAASPLGWAAPSASPRGG